MATYLILCAKIISRLTTVEYNLDLVCYHHQQEVLKIFPGLLACFM